MLNLVLDKVQRWLENNRDLLYIKLLDSKNNELFVLLAENDNSEIEQQIINDIQTLEAGKYNLRGTTAKNGKDTGAKFLPFTIQPEPKFNSGQFQNRTTPQNNNVMTLEEMNKMVAEARAEAYERGMKDAKIEILERRVTALEDDLKNVKKVINEKFDELDGKDDDDFLGEVKSLALNKAGDIMSGFGSQS